MPVDIGTLPATTPREIRVAFERLRTHANQLEAENSALRTQLAAQAPIPSFEEIRSALSATGSHPLNLTGLTGFPVPIGTDPTA